uniref:GST N-terminal domain-containing protein n=1 Tax=Phocoena sinus TaxID=42100 RepID=A0A8C9C794_PHOSS
MVLELFLDLYSPPCRAIYIFTRKNSIPFEMHPVELAQGEHLKPEFLKVNPLEKVPALRDGNFLVAESPLPSAATSSKTGPGLLCGEPVWRPPWALSSSRRPTGECFSLGTPKRPSGTPSWPRTLCRG